MGDFDYIDVCGGRPCIDIQNQDNVLPLIQVFEHYEVRNMDAVEVAGILGVNETDVRRGISYWRSDPGVYEDMEESVGGFEPSDHIYGAVETLDGKEPENVGLRSETVFAGLFESAEAPVTEMNVVDNPEKEYLPGSADETCLSWKRDGSDLGVHVSYVGSGPASVSYSVDGEIGEVLEVNDDVLGEMVGRMYRNAVFDFLK